jgi:uncharacterized protein
MNTSQPLFTQLEKDIQHTSVNLDIQTLLLHNLNALKTTQLNIMIVGATGAGKSSTINALFNMDIAKVGIGCSPETDNITSYTLHNLILWDTAGLGDGYENDRQHAKAIKNKLNETTKEGELLIDLVLVIIDGSTRDLGTSTQLIKEIIIPSLGDKHSDRILVAMNQADVAMKGKEAWNHEHNRPTSKSESFLNDKVASLKQRIFEATALTLTPIYYVAGYYDGGQQQRPYNLSKLLLLIVEHIPKNKRIILANQTLSEKKSTWRDDDNLVDYNQETRSRLWEGIIDSIHQGADIGADIGFVFGRTGEVIGRLIGGTLGALSGGLRSLFRL